ncbi:MAG TPA: enoyl-CoA hydratase-related protein, partial [Acetobacteraceae bacterium]|nr:enoyl-CoA hydratase-related protein [Acetobacteraceae bacterium]
PAMTEPAFCLAEPRGRVLVLTINRPEVLNALHRPAHLQMEAALDAFAADPELWVAIITGAGPRAFCAGNDLKYQAAGNDTTAVPTGFAGLTSRFELNKPVIAAVNGVAMGGGFEIALACDLIIAAENAVFALPEPRVGLAAMAGGLLRLPRQIGLKRAMGMILTGRHVPAREGLELGFVNEVVPEGEALAVAERWAARIAELSPMSIRASKEVVRRGLEMPLDEAYRLQREFPAAKGMRASEDFVEGPRAFAEKREPEWKGR